MRRAAAVLLVVPISMAGGIAPLSANADWDHTVKCHGFNVTIMGTNRSETIKGTKHADVIYARGGNDTIKGGKGNDVICTGSGRGVVEGGPGRDVIYLAGGDAYGGGADDEIFRSGSARGLIDGGGGNDVLRGGKGNDALVGDAGDDKITDKGGNNDVVDSRGDNSIRLGGGNDLVDSGSGFSRINAGGGNDQVFGSGNINAGDGDDYVRFVDCTTCADGDAFDIDLGLGDDSLSIGPDTGVPTPGAPDPQTLEFNVAAGEGVDSLEDYIRPNGTGLTVVQLGIVGTLTGPWHPQSLMGFENYTASDTGVAQNFDVTGSADANNITVFGSGSSIFGLGGDDILIGNVKVTEIDGGDGTDSCTDAVQLLNCE